MKNLSLGRYTLGVCVTGTLLAACGGSLESSSSLPASVIVQRFAPLLSKPLQTGMVPAYKGLKDLYISDLGAIGGPSPTIDVLKNKTYRELRIISGDVVEPRGNFLDEQGNLYVADPGVPNIKEYAPKATSPTFTYNASMMAPLDVSVDRAGNVYEADYPHTGDSFVNEYAQGTNKVTHTCSTGYVAATGIAVDGKGDVFVDTLNQIIEYKGGLTGCSGTVLGVSLNFGGGMALDKHDDIIVCDGWYLSRTRTVDVIDPPYHRVTRTLEESYVAPVSVRINKKNTLVFVSDLGREPSGIPGQVFVLKYPGGALVTTLGKAHGVYTPYSAVDGPNAVY